MTKPSSSWEAAYKKRPTAGYRQRGTHEKRLEAMSAFFRENHVRRILDLGCGDGRHLVYLAATGFEVSGLDFAPTALELARPGRNQYSSLRLHKRRRSRAVSQRSLPRPAAQGRIPGQVAEPCPQPPCGRQLEPGRPPGRLGGRWQQRDVLESYDNTRFLGAARSWRPPRRGVRGNRSAAVGEALCVRDQYL